MREFLRWLVVPANMHMNLQQNGHDMYVYMAWILLLIVVAILVCMQLRTLAPRS